MSDKLILRSIVASVAVDDYGEAIPNADEVAEAILAAGFKMRDPELEKRVEGLERWMRGEFT